MCRHIEGNRCSLGTYCHCHPQPDKDTYDDQYEQDDTTYIKSDYIKGTLLEQVPIG